jgi:hypothetical protein
VTRHLCACLLTVVALLARPLPAAADEVSFRTVVDATVPATAGLTITGTQGGCDLLLDNHTTQDVILYDMSKPPKPNRFPAAPRGASPRPPLAVHLVGAWPCVNLPAISEDQRWNHAPVTVLYWSLRGQVGSLAFQLRAHTQYDPELDPSSQWMLDLRIGAGALAVGGLLLAGPYLLARRRELLARA